MKVNHSEHIAKSTVAGALESDKRQANIRRGQTRRDTLQWEFKHNSTFSYDPSIIFAAKSDIGTMTTRRNY